ncbi:MAG: hypothetical protein AMXMBFR84_27840 [Candidatus Hydrogenedentota bacterium]|nr:P-II family nitrogen regulator [Candidatus Hydrogenedentota bacterium]
MKEIRAIVRTDAVHRILSALHDCEHFPGVTLSPCEGQSRGRGPGGKYVATEDSLDFRAMRLLMVFCADSTCDQIVAVIQKAAHTGNAADGLIVVTDAERIVRIRSGEEQIDAV